MLQSIRSINQSKVGSVVVRALFLVLIASFGFWGIGGFLRSLPSDTTVVTVGDDKISRDEVHNAIGRLAERMKQELHTNLDHDQLAQYGVPDSAVNQLITQHLLDLEAKKLHLVIGDAAIRTIVAANPDFQRNGQFDKNLFEALLQANGMTETSFVAEERIDMPRRQLLATVAGNAAPPDTLINLLFSHHNETRVADYVFLPRSSVGKIAAPDAATLQAYYKANPRLFTAPEYRGFTLLALTKNDVMNSIQISDADLQTDYDNNKDAYTTQETRDLQLINVTDAPTLAKVQAALANGMSFADAATKVAHQDPGLLDNGWLARADLSQDLATAAFTTPVGQAAAPIKTNFGWTLIRVAGDRPQQTKPFAEVKAQVLNQAKLDQVDDALFQLSNRVQDAIAAGADIPAIAQQFNLKPVRVAQVDASGKLPDGSALGTMPVPTQDLLATVFATDQGQSSDLKELKDSFYLVHTDKVTAPALRPFDTIADQVKSAWLADQQQTALSQQALKLTDAAKKLGSLAKAAAAAGLDVQTTPPFNRDVQPDKMVLPAQLTSTVFSLNIGDTQAASGIRNGAPGIFVAELTQVTRADMSKQQGVAAQYAHQIAQNYGEEMLTEFGQDLRQTYPVTIDRTKLDQLY